LFYFLLDISSNKNWDPSEEVYHWLGTLGKKYVDYAPLFKQRNVNRYRDLYNLTDENLENFEIKNQKHRQTILKEIEKLKKKSK
jgi:NAD-dependent DNA ligase